MFNSLPFQIKIHVLRYLGFSDMISLLEAFPEDKLFWLKAQERVMLVIGDNLEGDRIVNKRANKLLLLLKDGRCKPTEVRDPIKHLTITNCGNADQDDFIGYFSNFLSTHSRYVQSINTIIISNLAFLAFPNRIGKFPFELQSVKKLDLSSNKLQTLPLWLELSFPNLTHLNLSSNFLNGREMRSLSKLRKLEELDLSENYLERIPRLDLPCLVRLNLKECNISKIRGLAHLRNLRFLNLAKNPLTVLQNISHLINLQTLDLRGTEIRAAENFEQLVNLEILFVEQVSLEDNSLFEPSSNLKTLQISGPDHRNLHNGESNLGSQLPVHLLNLNHLYINNCSMRYMNGLQRFIFLKSLDLSKNKILKIEEISNLKNLEILDLTYNCITHIENIQDLVNLRILILKGNKISKIENLEQNVNLKVLDLSKNKIRKIEGLGYLTKLRLLNIRSNFIDDIENLESNVKLEDLNLSHNQIMQLKGVSKLVSLWSLDLSGNYINKIENLETNLKLRRLDVSGNSIRSMEGACELLNLQNLGLEGNPISKIENFDSFPNLNELNLSNTFIDNLDVIDSLQKLRTFHFRGQRDLFSIMIDSKCKFLDRLSVFNGGYDKDEPLGSFTWEPHESRLKRCTDISQYMRDLVRHILQKKVQVVVSDEDLSF